MRDLEARGLNAPKLVCGDGALGLWGALRDVFPHAAQQRCWVHYADPRVMPMGARRACKLVGRVWVRSA